MRERPQALWSILGVMCLHDREVLNMDNLVEAVHQAEKWLDRYEPQGHRIGEENTKAGLIEPILAALGWDVRDPDEVHREYRRLPTDNPVDYALLILRVPRLLVEAKGIGERLDDPRWANQTVAYATAAGVEWVVITNGAEWRIYNSHAPVPLEQKLFRAFKLRDDMDEAVAVLELLSKTNMNDNRIQELWKAYFVDQQVHEALVDLFSGGEPAKELVAAVRARTKNLDLKDLRTSLTRVRARFEFPALRDLAAPSGAGTPSVVSETAGSARAAAPQRVTAAEQAVKLADLISRGLLSAGATLMCQREGRELTGTLLADGSIEVAGATYRTPSAAGAAAKMAMAGGPLPDSVKATDGWGFWQTKDSTGAVVTLKDLRRRAARS